MERRIWYVRVLLNVPIRGYSLYRACTGSDIIMVKKLGTSTVVINSLSVAKDLLDKRSVVYSDR